MLGIVHAVPSRKASQPEVNYDYHFSYACTPLCLGVLWPVSSPLLPDRMPPKANKHLAVFLGPLAAFVRREGNQVGTCSGGGFLFCLQPPLGKGSDNPLLFPACQKGLSKKSFPSDNIIAKSFFILSLSPYSTKFDESWLRTTHSGRASGSSPYPEGGSGVLDPGGTDFPRIHLGARLTYLPALGIPPHHPG